jgi:hypothetical protein
VEPQRTNLITYSEQFDNGSWAKLNTTITQNTTIAPDGNLTADKIVENNTAGLHRMYTISSCSASTTYTASIFVKKSERTRFEFLETTLGGCVFDLTNGTIVSGTDGFIESYNNDWYRCGIKRTTSVSQSVFVIQVRLIISGTNNNYLGDGTSGVFIWGAQLEAGSYATSYIPTVASTSTRNADVISKTGISSLISSTEGVLYVEMNAFDNISRISLSDGSTNNRVSFRITNDNIDFQYRVGGSYSYRVDVYVDNSNTNKMAMSFNNGVFVGYLNGVAIGSPISGTSLSQGVLDRLNFNDGNSSDSFEGNIKEVQLYNTALTDQELQQLTTI